MDDIRFFAFDGVAKIVAFFSEQVQCPASGARAIRPDADPQARTGKDNFAGNLFIEAEYDEVMAAVDELGASPSGQASGTSPMSSTRSANRAQRHDWGH